MSSADYDKPLAMSKDATTKDIDPSSQDSKSSTLTTLSKKINPFSKNESPEQRQDRIAQKQRNKELIEKYGGPPAGQTNDGYPGTTGAKGGKRGAAVLGLGVAAGGGGGGGC